MVFSPGHIEGLFTEVVGRNTDDIAAILDKFGCLIIDPALLDGNYQPIHPAYDGDRTRLETNELRHGSKHFAVTEQHNRAIRILLPLAELRGFKYLTIWQPGVNTDAADVQLD
jgi:hypothetical protein